MQQAEEALKKEELTQARSFAERAQNIAKLLALGTIERYSVLSRYSRQNRSFRRRPAAFGLIVHILRLRQKRTQYVVDRALTTT